MGRPPGLQISYFVLDLFDLVFTHFALFLSGLSLFDNNGFCGAVIGSLPG